MNLFVIRHAAAVPRTSKVDDASRPLTEKGRRRWRQAVRGLKRLGVRFDRAYHSPWLRAVETAEGLAGLVDVESIVTTRLAESPSPELLRGLRGERVAVVGHQPWLGELVELLVLERDGHGVWLELEKGAVAWLEGTAQPGGMVLHALLTPKFLRAVR